MIKHSSRGARLAFVALVSLAACRAAPGVSSGAGGIGPAPGDRPSAAPLAGAVAPLPPGALDIPALVGKVKPVVVNVTSEQAVRPPSHSTFDWPFDFFFGPPGGPGQPGRGPRGDDARRQQARGSGFLIDSAGHVVTNAHVVEGADVVRVRLLDDRELRAKVKGRDRRLDVAVLELEGARDLPAATLGSSDALQVGEYVIAVGNPFGLGHTVTMGIVSAKSRAIGAGPYDDFIQTDAAINPGNSGGPLFDVKGEVVGINTAITAQGSGIGFAIPIDEVKDVLPQLLEKGHVERARLGVVVQAIDWPLARTLGLDRPTGALVAEVEPGSPAEKAGLRERDILLSIDGQKVDQWQELPRLVARRAPGSRATLEVLRDKKTSKVEVTLARLDDEEAAGQGGGPAKPSATVGVGVEDAPEGGALVRRVLPGSAADSVLEAGDVVLEVNRAPVTNASDFARLVAAAPAGSVMLLKIRRDGRVRYVALEGR